MVLLGDVGQVKAHFGPFRDSVNLSARWVHGLRRTYHGHGNHFWHTRWYSEVTWVKWKLILLYLENRKIGAHFAKNLPRAWKSVWAHILVLLGNVCQVGACFSPFGDRCTVCAECTIGFGIIFGTPNGTLR
jgi:hypothetical protein